MRLPHRGFAVSLALQHPGLAIPRHESSPFKNADCQRQNIPAAVWIDGLVVFDIVGSSYDHVIGPRENIRAVSAIQVFQLRLGLKKNKMPLERLHFSVIE